MARARLLISLGEKGQRKKTGAGGECWERGGFVKMEDIGCVHMLKETVGYTRGASTD